MIGRPAPEAPLDSSPLGLKSVQRRFIQLCEDYTALGQSCSKTGGRMWIKYVHDLHFLLRLIYSSPLPFILLSLSLINSEAVQGVSWGLAPCGESMLLFQQWQAGLAEEQRQLRGDGEPSYHSAHHRTACMQLNVFLCVCVSLNLTQHISKLHWPKWTLLCPADRHRCYLFPLIGSVTACCQRRRPETWGSV